MKKKQKKTLFPLMENAISNAKNAYDHNEIPVGCIICDPQNNIIASTYNKIEKNNCSFHHAEMLAIQTASKKINNKYLIDCSIYVTLEPCAMCLSAISNAKITNLYFGAFSKEKNNYVTFFENNKNYYKPKIIGGIKKQECENLINNFFKSIRK